MAASVGGAELVFVGGADPQQQLELVAEVGSHHLRAVRGHRERHIVLAEGAEHVAHLVLARQRPGEQGRGGADLQDDLLLADRRHQLGILRGEDSVPDPIGPERLDHLLDLGDPVLVALLADVDRHAEAGRARLLDQGPSARFGNVR